MGRIKAAMWQNKTDNSIRYVTVGGFTGTEMTGNAMTSQCQPKSRIRLTLHLPKAAGA